MQVQNDQGPAKQAQKAFGNHDFPYQHRVLDVDIFLVTGQLTPPQDPDVILPETKSSDPLPPPDALYARGDGALVYREAPVTAADYLANHLPEREGAPRQVKLAADKNLGAGKLLQHVKALYGAGADAVVVVTRTTNK